MWISIFKFENYTHSQNKYNELFNEKESKINTMRIPEV